MIRKDEFQKEQRKIKTIIKEVKLVRDNLAKEVVGNLEEFREFQKLVWQEKSSFDRAEFNPILSNNEMEARRYEYQLFLEYENKLKGLNEIERDWYKINGSTKSDLDNEILHITVNSPLGKCLLGKKINEEFTYYVLKEKIEGKILDIKK